MKNNYQAHIFGVFTAVVLVGLLSFAQSEESLRISSTTFDDGGFMPLYTAYTQEPQGFNINPHFAWSSDGDEAESYAIMMYDTHPDADNFVHWCISGIPANRRAINEGDSGVMRPSGSYEWPNSSGLLTYGGPTPPAGSGLHEYIFKFYALNVEDDLSSFVGEGRCSLESFAAAIEGKIVAEGTYTGYFGLDEDNTEIDAESAIEEYKAAAAARENAVDAVQNEQSDAPVSGETADKDEEDDDESVQVENIEPDRPLTLRERREAVLECRKDYSVARKAFHTCRQEAETDEAGNELRLRDRRANILLCRDEYNRARGVYRECVDHIE
ncbi:hypothetical protein COV82_05960 [Candidatus Peregrinibacteria bacterium CG11_big_fil_rev_8_21_14_0_20_46_8]|nr:MAG: hypothetical protein COV82_05960 [Candidatus Peregrinibacteria bacterium CG11_big_fil_rev_8_21_14_0_20_46_8]